MSRGTEARTCTGKVGHPTRRQALAHLWSLVCRRGAAPGMLHTYRCPHCAAWHVGHVRRHR